MTAKELYLEAMRRTDARDHDGFLELQADGTQWTVPGSELDGKDAVRAWVLPFWQGFSSYRHELSRVLEVGDTVVAEGTWSGVQDGVLAMPDGDVPPTGKSISFRFAMVVDVDVSAQVARTVRLYFDQLGFLAQLGLAPDAAAA
jgi:ketosteroid isomerase-like protein